MFPVRNANEATSTTGSVQLNVASTSNLRTSTAVVKSLAKGLLEASSGQASISKFLNFKFGMGQQASNSVSLWINLRKMTNQMETLEQLAIKANRPMNALDYKHAALRSVGYLNRLLQSLKEEEKSHPSFRKELIEHLENMIRWYPQAPQVWVMVCKSLQPGECVTFQNRQLDSFRCQLVVQRILAQARRPSGVQRFAAMQAGQV